MEAFFSKEIQAGLDKARIEQMKKSSRLRVCTGEKMQPILNMWKSGFAIDADAQAMRGLVDVYDGSVHLFQCLIVTSEEELGQRRYEFKRATAVAEQPAVDFERRENAPIGLIEDTR